MKKKLVSLWRKKRNSGTFTLIVFSITILFPALLFGFIIAMLPVSTYPYVLLVFMTYIAIVLVGYQYLDRVVYYLEKK